MINPIENEELAVSVRAKLNQAIASINDLNPKADLLDSILFGSTPPATRRDGSPLQYGDRWFSGSDPIDYFWSGTSWKQTTPFTPQLIEDEYTGVEPNGLYYVESSETVFLTLPEASRSFYGGETSSSGIIEIAVPLSQSLVLKQPPGSIFVVDGIAVPKTSNGQQPLPVVDFKYGLAIQGGTINRISACPGFNQWLFWSSRRIRYYNFELMSVEYD